MRRLDARLASFLKVLFKFDFVQKAILFFALCSFSNHLFFQGAQLYLGRRARAGSQIERGAILQRVS